MNETEFKTNLGSRIKDLRRKHNYTQESFGEKIGRSQRQVSLIELGESFPSPVTLINIATVLNCSMRDLFDFEPIIDINDMNEELHNMINAMPDEKLKTLYLIAKNL